MTPHAHTAAASRPPGRCTAVDLCVHIPLPNRGHHQHVTRISRTSTNTYDDSEIAERGDGAVGGIKSKDIEHLVGFKMGWSATPKEGGGGCTECYAADWEPKQTTVHVCNGERRGGRAVKTASTRRPAAGLCSQSAIRGTANQPSAKPTGWRGRGGRIQAGQGSWIVQTTLWILRSAWLKRADPRLQVRSCSFRRSSWKASFHHVLQRKKSTSKMIFFFILRVLIGRWSGLNLPLPFTPD